ncbi:RISC-loading complex subunit TARBP2-like [Linepithema humile]|uniref:RISC-loading complex subunit TARBP2-like n=1 Tax=Linepithema humile TaxID=83485 RepID=UPI0006235243|nr:PREDICTED: RISC-loading complex subunit TARBP2-like [Linepithema humile]
MNMNKTPVSILQEMMVKQGMIPDYELIHDGGGRHVNTFTYKVTCDGLSAIGMGRCKKDAKHEAAKAMLTEIAKHRNYPQLPAASTPAQSPSRSPFHSSPLPAKISANVPFVNAIGELQELCAENHLKDPEYILVRDVGPPHARVFTIRCTVSNFKEDGVATTKKQAKHDAAKRMVERIKGLVDGLNDLQIDEDEEESSDSIETMNKNARECYQTLIKSKMVNLGIKLDDYHIKLKDSLEAEKRSKILQELRCIFPDKLSDNSHEYVTNEFLMDKLSRVETLLSDANITLNMKEIETNGKCFVTAIVLNTCPSITQMGKGNNKTIASWEALLQIINSLTILLSE